MSQLVRWYVGHDRDLFDIRVQAGPNELPETALKSAITPDDGDLIFFGSILFWRFNNAIRSVCPRGPDGCGLWEDD